MSEDDIYQKEETIPHFSSVDGKMVCSEAENEFSVSSIFKSRPVLIKLTYSSIM